MSLQSPPAAAEVPPGPAEGHPPGAELSQGSAAAPSAQEGGEEEEEEEEGEKEKEKEKEKEGEKSPPIPSASAAAARVGPVSARARLCPSGMVCCVWRFIWEEKGKGGSIVFIFVHIPFR